MSHGLFKIGPLNVIIFSLIEFPIIIILIALQYVDGINLGFPYIFFIVSYVYLCLIVKSIPYLRLKNWILFSFYVFINLISLIFHYQFWINIIFGHSMCDLCP